MEKTKWTTFWDMHSGGSQKEKWPLIFIEAPKNEAKIIFYSRFGHNPERVTCTCCGDDYSISEENSLEQATGYHRIWSGYIEEANEYGEYQTLKEFIKGKKAKVIYAKDIKKNEKVGVVPKQGYIWQD